MKITLLPYPHTKGFVTPLTEYFRHRWIDPQTASAYQKSSLSNVFYVHQTAGKSVRVRNCGSNCTFQEKTLFYSFRAGTEKFTKVLSPIHISNKRLLSQLWSKTLLSVYLLLRLGKEMWDSTRKAYLITRCFFKISWTAPDSKSILLTIYLTMYLDLQQSVHIKLV